MTVGPQMMPNAMALFFLMLTVTEARNCYPSKTTMTPYNILKEATVETQRGCEVLCDAKSECVGFSFKDGGFSSSCVLLSLNTANEICTAETTIFLKQTSGCPARSNITAEFGVDPCIDSMIPIKQALGVRELCPQIKSILYVIRAIDANGKRITLDNDVVNTLGWDGEMWLHQYKWNGLDEAMPIVAAVCAVAGATKCPCEPYKHISSPPNWPAEPEVDGICGKTPATLYFDLAKGPSPGWKWGVGAADFVKCKAGLWIVWSDYEKDSIGVTGLTCSRS